MAVAVVHFARGTPATRTSSHLDGRAVTTINSQLRSTRERANPTQLLCNSGICYRGNMLNGAAFIVSPEERRGFISARPSNAEVIFPYLGGEEINTSPTHDFHRYVINFGKRALVDAGNWPELLERIRVQVKPLRDAVTDNTGKGGHGKKYWWQFLDRCDPLMQALKSVGRCLVVARVTKHLVFAWQPKDRVFSDALFVFALDAFTQFACLQSRIHEPWVRRLSSSMRTDLRYAATECFETFPFPQPDPRVGIAPLEAIGEKLYETRAKYMVDTDQGLTKTYNALKDPANAEPRIVALRRIHEEMDRAVLDAYGWTDITVPAFCPGTDEEGAALQEFEDKIMDRLYVLNAERASEEKRLGLGSKKGGKKAGGEEKVGKKAGPDEQKELF